MLFNKVNTSLFFIVMSTCLLETFAFSVSRVDNSDTCQNQIAHFLAFYVLSGEPAAIHCPAFQYLQTHFSDLPEHSLELVWTRNFSENIGEESRIQANEEVLWFYPAIKEDSGIYSCILRNSSFCVEVAMNFNVFTLTEVSLTDIAYGQYAIEQSSYQMHCPDLGDFTNIHTGVRLQWLKDGNLLPKDTMKYEMLDGNTYIAIKDVHKDDEGYYTCEFAFTHENREYSVSRIISLQVIAQDKREQPVMLQPKHQSIAASTGSQLTIPCKVFTESGGSNLIVWWLANDSYIDEFFEDGRVRQGISQETEERGGFYIEVPLVFEEVKDADFSTDFKCIGSNDYGTQVLPTHIRQAASHFSWYIVAVPAALICVIIAIISIYKYRKSGDKEQYTLAKS
ncbi:interleukin-1 receptor type 2 [Pelobates fuscus]|uniref:interleukin-1 receptor type 2 n=1 Tax=Pelobates fuscus TaxID=191477 RepID=UPI002FE42F0E